MGLCISISATSLAQNKYLSFKDGYTKEKKFNAAVKTLDKGESYIELEYRFDGAYLKQIEDEKNTAYLSMYMDGAYYNSTNSTVDIATYKRVPYFKDILVLPESADYSTAKVEIVNVEYQDYKCPFDENDKLVLLNGDNYEKLVNDKFKQFFPNEITTCAIKSCFRNVPFVSVNTFPVLYDTASNTLRCYSEIKYRVVFGKDTVYKKPKMTKLAYDLLGRISTNKDILDDYDNTLLKNEAATKECDYLIVTTDAYKVAAEKMASWKTRLGYKCRILSRAQWKGTYPAFAADTIMDYCQKLNYMPDYLLVLGSHADIPAKVLFLDDELGTTNQTVKTWYSDSYLGTYTKPSTLIDDMVRARISVYSPQEAINVVEKIIAYEKTPTTDAGFYDSALAIGLYDSDDGVRESKSFDFLSAIEGTASDLETIGYNVDRHYINYYKDVLPQYFLNGNKLPEEMYMEENVSNDFWDKDPSNITNSINNGKSIVVYNGHGNEGAFSRGTYTQEDVAELKNGNKTPVFFNFACSTGAFNYTGKDSLCFAECLLNKENGGAVGVYANTRTILHSESKTMGANMLSALFKNQDISVATAILQSTFYTEFDYTHDLAQYFGDPSMRLWTVEPAKFRPFINKYGTTITVKSYVAGSKITVCSIGDWGETYYKSVELSNDTEATFEGVNVPCYVTITKNNYVPFMTVSKDDLYLQNMSLNRYHDIVANSITTGNSVTEDLPKGDFVVESGITKLRGEKSITLKSGTSVKNGASLIVRKGAEDTYSYKGNGKDRTSEIPLCFNTLTDRFYSNESYVYDNGNYKNPTSVSETQSEGVSIYPNPTNGRINVVANDIINSVVVLDMTGNTLMSESANSNNASLDLSTLGKGMYLVKVVTADESIVKKVVLK